ncbi:MAG TPA: ATP-binding protein [Chloroflexota bacterium]|nr:ATP-binding protein [Chloroflexota bacterium]
MRALVDGLRALDASARRGLDAVLDEIVNQARRLLDAEHAGVQLRVPGTDDFVRRRRSPMAEPQDTVLRVGLRFRPDALAQEAFRTGQALFAVDFRDDERIDAAVRAALPTVASSMVAPMLVDEEPVGFLFAHWSKRHEPQPGDAEIARLLAQHAALVVGLAQALGDARQAQAAAETARARAAFLAAASSALASSLDYEVTLRKVARLAVPQLADWCAVDVVQDDGRIERVATAHVDPSKDELLKEMTRRYPVALDQPRPAAIVLRTGRPYFEPEVTENELATSARDEEHLRMLLALRARSAITMPLVARGRPIGVLSLRVGDPARAYTEADLAWAEDLAERCALAIDNARLYREAQTAVRARDEFLSVAAHELRTPIAALRGFAQLAVRQLDREAVDRDRLRVVAHQVDEQSRRLTTLSERLLDVARIEAGRLVLEPRETDLAGILRALVERLRGIYEAHELVLTTPETLTAVVDPLRLEQVIGNLVDNAAKFSPPGAPIEIELGADGGRARIAVRDHGLGIPAEQRDRVFGRFVQVHGERHYAGLGVGLFVSQQIVELHGGRIEVEAPQDGGTRMVVWVPLGGAGARSAGRG